MCKQKASSGIGFKNLQAFNKAMLAKRLWRILQNPNSLVARVLKSRYFPTGDILNAKLGTPYLTIGEAFIAALILSEWELVGEWAMGS